MKKIISAILIAIAVSNTIQISAEQIISDWAKPAIDAAQTAGFISESDNDYTQNITREKFCNIAFKMLSQTVRMPTLINKIHFTDTDNPNVNALNQIGIINGKSESEFAPNDFITREEAAAILARISEYINLISVEDKDIVYNDCDQISDWAKSDVILMNNLDIMTGDGGYFMPKGFYTEEQATATIIRLFDRFNRSHDAKTVPETFADKINAEMPSDKNYMFSPFSLKTTLAMLANGADGETLSEILSAAEIEDLSVFNQNSKLMIQKYINAQVFNLNIANSIWINESNTNQIFSDTFKQNILEYYFAESAVVTDDNAVNTINSWVDKNTNSKIKSIVNTSDFMAMLVNAVYFKGSWVNDFYEHNTKKDTFVERGGNKADIDFMTETGYFDYSVVNNVRIAELPYKSSKPIMADDGNSFEIVSDDLDISMFVMISDSDFNAESVLKNADFKNTYISLSMPKFEFEFSTGLNSILKNIGIHRAFTEACELQNMVDKGNMQLTDTIQKTYIKVDEKGTEAAVVTGFAGGATSFTEKPVPIEFKLNKPFTFIIRDNTSYEILFMGEYAFAE